MQLYCFQKICYALAYPEHDCLRVVECCCELRERERERDREREREGVIGELDMDIVLLITGETSTSAELLLFPDTEHPLPGRCAVLQLCWSHQC